ncbi:hypothetical protein PV08_00184 [Exophiala spinifera]|uniref:Uncharacterized protein n=1 Tax=Exophiala spinifera TaxID=91928 RepID=A0A0D1YWF0_9EURO|nr:uncharacterized protein PV08_00184 [Exophiala spinifera]KIW19611.1 hypothetical protein PV08_00184 [Exophiala spinifera]
MVRRGRGRGAESGKQPMSVEQGLIGTLAHLVFEAPAPSESQDQLVEWLSGDAWKFLVGFFPSMLAMHLLEHDDSASTAGSSTKSYDNVNFQSPLSGGGEGGKAQRWMLLAEFSDPFGAPFAT